MQPIGKHLKSGNAAAVIAAIRSSTVSQGRDSSAQGRPFITISRQAGAGGRSLAAQLMERLNSVDRGALPWTVWDNELVEKVAAEHHLPPAAVGALGESKPSWLEEVLTSLALTESDAHPDEFKVYRRVASTIRALAEMGRVIIVGRGGAYVTRDLPGGVHVRLVAPLQDRIAATAKAQGIPPAAAAAAVREKDLNREAFYRRYWPNRPPIPENFTVTFNTAAVKSDALVESIMALISSTMAFPKGTQLAHV